MTTTALICLHLGFHPRRLVVLEGTREGAGENYGYAGSTENYQETLNHALDRAN